MGLDGHELCTNAMHPVVKIFYSSPLLHCVSPWTTMWVCSMVEGDSGARWATETTTMMTVQLSVEEKEGPSLYLEMHFQS